MNGSLGVLLRSLAVRAQIPNDDALSQDGVPFVGDKGGRGFGTDARNGHTESLSLSPSCVGLLGGGLHCSVRPVWVRAGGKISSTRPRAGEPLCRATLSQSLYPELSTRSFSKLDQTDHIGRWDGAQSECVGPKLGVHESDEKNEENHNLRFNSIFRILCVNISPDWIGSRRPLPVPRHWIWWGRFVRARWLLRLPDRDQRIAYALRGRWFRRQWHYRRSH